MDRNCSRPLCNRDAAAQLVFVYASKDAWLQDLPAQLDRNLLELCSLHADRFSAPYGWTASDKRSMRLIDNSAPARVRRLAG